MCAPHSTSTNAPGEIGKKTKYKKEGEAKKEVRKKQMIFERSEMQSTIKCQEQKVCEKEVGGWMMSACLPCGGKDGVKNLMSRLILTEDPVSTGPAKPMLLTLSHKHGCMGTYTHKY